MVTRKFAFLFSLLVLLSANAFAQAGRGGRGGPPGPPPTPKAAARFDITGYWVSLVTEDWRFRQFTPPKGDFTSVPLNANGKKVMEAWDAAKDEAAGDTCKAYGAPGLMRIPTRLHITWQDDNTLKLETDAGKQTRLFHFAGPEGTGGDLQGYSRATWDYPVPPINTFFGGLDFGFTLPPPPGGSLKVATSKLKPGYLRKNGVPYSGRTTMTEYFDRLEVPGGDTYLLVTAEVSDPGYLSQLFWTSTHFKKENDASGWNPTPCSAR